MINVNDLKNGVYFMYYGDPFKVLGYEHIKMARGGATVKLKVKHLINGSIKEIGLANGSKVEEADVENKTMQYLYNDGETYFFMDNLDYTQYEIPKDNTEYEAKFLVEGKDFQIMLYQNKPIAIVLNASMFYKVTYAPPTVKGNTATSATKTAVLENGLELEVPLFIKEGDTIKVNTESGLYVNRA